MQEQKSHHTVVLATEYAKVKHTHCVWPFRTASGWGGGRFHFSQVMITLFFFFHFIIRCVKMKTWHSSNTIFRLRVITGWILPGNGLGFCSQWGWKRKKSLYSKCVKMWLDFIPLGLTPVKSLYKISEHCKMPPCPPTKKKKKKPSIYVTKGGSAFHLQVSSLWCTNSLVLPAGVDRKR